MKKILFCVSLFCVFAFSQTSKEEGQTEEVQVQIDSTNQLTEVEKVTMRTMQNYIADLNAPDWKNRLGKYWSNNSYNDFVLSHEKFRQTWTNYKVTIKHLVVTGRDGIMWARISAVHSGKTDSDIARGIEATGKPVEWEEAWFFEVIDGKQGNKWDLLKDELSIMRQLDIKCIPQD